MTHDGGPAFPRITKIESPNTIGHMSTKYSEVKSTEGMSLRDHFAGQALAGMAAFSGSIGISYSARKIANMAYEAADAMLKAREAEL